MTSPADWTTPSYSKGDSPNRSRRSPVVGAAFGAYDVGLVASFVVLDGGRTCTGCSCSERFWVLNLSAQ